MILSPVNKLITDTVRLRPLSVGPPNVFTFKQQGVHLAVLEKPTARLLLFGQLIRHKPEASVNHGGLR